MSQSIKRANMEKLSQFREQLVQHPRLTYLFFELTDACNLCCLHCGSNASPKNSTYLPVKDIKMVIDQVRKKYPPQSIMICLTGGEPLLHPDFFEILSYAKQCGFPCGMTTNGTLLTHEMSETMVSHGIDSVSFSLDGLQDTHDWFRNKPGSFQKAIQGIRNLLDAAQGSILTQATTVIHKKNFCQLEEIFRSVSNLGVHSWRVVNLEPIGRALEHDDLLLEPPQFLKLLSFIREKRYDPNVSMEVTYGCSHYLPEEYERTVRDHYFLCGSGIYVASVMCNGDIYSCLDIERRPELVQGNIKTDDFTEVWEHGFQAFRRDRSADHSACVQCEDRRFCRGDSAHTWDYTNQKPLLCLKQTLSEKGV